MVPRSQRSTAIDGILQAGDPCPYAPAFTFGVIDIAILVAYGLTSFSQTGFQQALVQKSTDITADMDAAWTMLAIRGVVLSSSCT